MKKALITAAIVLLGVTTVSAQVDIDFKQPPTREAAGGDGVPPQLMTAGVYLVTPFEPKSRDGVDIDLNPGGGVRTDLVGKSSMLAMVTFNSDHCADATPIWDLELGTLPETNGAPHGTWEHEGPQRIVATLFYLQANDAGLISEFVRTDLTVDFSKDTKAGTGVLVVNRYAVWQAAAAIDRDNPEPPIYGSRKKTVTLARTN